jgi:hypothetical protein
MDLLREERRLHRRVPIHLSLRCRRLGRLGFDEAVEALDLSRGGVRFQFTGDLATGDVVLCTVGDAEVDVTLKGLVVHVSRWAGAGAAHVAFTSLSEATQDLLAALLDRCDMGGPESRV